MPKRISILKTILYTARKWKGHKHIFHKNKIL